MATDELTAEQIAACGEKLWDDVAVSSTVAEHVINSHELLRADRDRLREERDKEHQKYLTKAAALAEVTVERDALREERDNLDREQKFQHARADKWVEIVNARNLTVEQLREEIAAKDAEIQRLKAAPPAEGPTWQPIETFVDHGQEAFFWIVAKTASEAYTDTNGKPITADVEPRLLRCRWKGWNGLSKPTHWMPLPTPPRDPAGKE